MEYNIKLSIAYDYESPAVGGRHLVCLMPLDRAEGQSVAHAALKIEPSPAERLDRRDFFGNQITEFAFRGAQTRIALHMTARVTRSPAAPAPADPMSLAALPQALAQCRDVGPLSPLHFLSPSIRVPRDPEMIAFAHDLTNLGLNILEAVLAIGRGLNKHITFDAKATTVDILTSEAFAKARGVCQDYAHIMIACLRGIGVPAGYVSGYLRTLPPKGQPRLDGADAMHAWVRAWCGPQAGWVCYDPTNACFAGADHITAAHGRDYSDVAPVKGSLRTSGNQKSGQAVDVVPLPNEMGE